MFAQSVVESYLFGHQPELFAKCVERKTNMTLEQQVTSLELSKKLRDLGVKQDGIYAYYFNKGHYVGSKIQPDEPHYLDKNTGYEFLQYPTMFECSAFTVAELGEMLPEGYFTAPFLKGKKHNWWAGFYVEDGDAIHQEKIRYQSNEANARAKMLIYLLENKLI